MFPFLLSKTLIRFIGKTRFVLYVKTRKVRKKENMEMPAQRRVFVVSYQEAVYR